MGKVELLAPAGSMEALYAAVENGADAVYLGGKVFNARQYASNFDEEELRSAVSYAHKRNVSIYVTMNISLKEEELKDVKSYLDLLYEIGVDALIVQDLGLFKLIKEYYPDFSIHASTQMTIHNSRSVSHLQKVGFSRVVLSRELSYSEIEEISKDTDIDLEVFVHGALCVSYSGQCLMSSMIGGRSGNRGTCAQTCRMPFSIERDADKAKIETRGDYILSPKDLNTVEQVGKLIDIGVKSFKIEGRMKKPEYVAVVVQKYRKAIDYYMQNRKDSIDEIDQAELEQVFSRGFTKGLIGNDFGKNFISLDKPNNKGIYLGEALNVRGKKVTLRIKKDIVLGDALNIETKDGDNLNATVDKIYLNRISVDSATQGDLTTVELYAKVSPGDRLFKTYDKKLADRAKSSFENREQEKIPLDLKLDIKLGEKPVIKACFDGIEFESEIEVSVEKSLKSGLTAEKVKQQIEKFGNSDYYLNKLELNLEEESFLPIKKLNELRRNLVEKIDDYRIKKDNRIKNYINPFAEDVAEKSYKNEKIELSVKIENFDQIDYLNPEKVSRLYLPAEKEAIDYIKELKHDGLEIYLSTDRIVMNQEFEKLEKLIYEAGGLIDGVSVGNLGVLELVKAKFENLNIHADSSFNILNSESVKYLNRFGVSSAVISPELNFNEISELTEGFSFPYEAISYGYLPLMFMKHCPLSLAKNCGSDRDCNSCSMQRGYSLVDRKDMRFRMSRKKDITTIYNSQRLFIPEYIHRLESAEVKYARLDFTSEKSEIREIQDIYFKALENEVDKDEIQEYIRQISGSSNFTKGHYFRGII